MHVGSLGKCACKKDIGFVNASAQPVLHKDTNVKFCPRCEPYGKPGVTRQVVLDSIIEACKDAVLLNISKNYPNMVASTKVHIKVELELVDSSKVKEDNLAPDKFDTYNNTNTVYSELTHKGGTQSCF